MKRLIGAFAALLVWTTPLPARAADNDQPHLILVTLDGMRWEEVFGGPDQALLDDPAYTDKGMRSLAAASWFDVPDRAAALLPFLHDVVAKQGVLWGDRSRGECMRVANAMWFSYPGYNEILTGRPDPEITSNDKNDNANVTFLEWLNRRPDFTGRVVATAMWDVFPFIINQKRSGVPVNPGLGTRFPTDVLALRLALDAIAKPDTRVLYVAFGDTDELAHVGDYDQYLWSANRTDDAIRQLWEAAQADPAWRGNTTLIVTTDHGRGHVPGPTWKDHSSAKALANNPSVPAAIRQTGIVGSNEIWFGAIGPRVRAKGAKSDICLSQSQIAASSLTALGIDPASYDPRAAPALPQITNLEFQNLG